MTEPKELFEELYKIVIIGPSLTGKTSFLSTYISKNETGMTKPKYNDFEAKVIELQSGKKVDAQIWDISGQEEYRELASLYYKGTSGALILFDLTSSKSFCDAKLWMEEFLSENSCKHMILVGNKVDLCEENPEKREVSKEIGLKFAQEHKIGYFETSALNYHDVKKVFQGLLEKIDSENSENAQVLPEPESNYWRKNILFLGAVVVLAILIIYQILK